MKIPKRFETRWFGLDGHRVIKVNSLDEWARWFENANRHVAVTDLAGGIVSVSTVFLGIDHRWGGGGPPILFETMVFGLSEADTDNLMDRYSS